MGLFSGHILFIFRIYNRFVFGLFDEQMSKGYKQYDRRK